MNLGYFAGEDSYEKARAIENDSIVKYIFLERNVSKLGKTLLQEEKDHFAQLADETGIESYRIDDIEENEKNCGIEWTVALTHVKNEIGEFEPLFKDSVIPDFNIFTTFVQLPISRIAKEINKGEKKYNMHLKIGQPEQKKLKTTFLPFNPYPLKNPEWEKARKDKMIAVLNEYNKSTNERAIIILDNMLGHKNLLHKINKDEKVIYYSPEVGMQGFAKYYSQKGFYFFLNASGWNKDTKEEEIYILNHQCINSTKDSVKLANSLLKQYKDKQEEYRLQKESEEALVKQNSPDLSEDDDIPSF